MPTAPAVAAALITPKPSSSSIPAALPGFWYARGFQWRSPVSRCPQTPSAIPDSCRLSSRAAGFRWSLSDVADSRRRPRPSRVFAGPAGSRRGCSHLSKSGPNVQQCMFRPDLYCFAVLGWPKPKHMTAFRAANLGISVLFLHRSIFRIDLFRSSSVRLHLGVPLRSSAEPHLGVPRACFGQTPATRFSAHQTFLAHRFCIDGLRGCE